MFLDYKTFPYYVDYLVFILETASSDIFILPSLTSQKRINNLSNVDFPLPLHPTIPVIEFLGIFNDRLDKMISSSYEKVTFLL